MARDKTSFSMSRPFIFRSSILSLCETFVTDCSIMGPSSRFWVT